MSMTMSYLSLESVGAGECPYILNQLYSLKPRLVFHRIDPVRQLSQAGQVPLQQLRQFVFPRGAEAAFQAPDFEKH